jgi:hypothetical protein
MKNRPPQTLDKYVTKVGLHCQLTEHPGRGSKANLSFPQRFQCVSCFIYSCSMGCASRLWVLRQPTTPHLLKQRFSSQVLQNQAQPLWVIHWNWSTAFSLGGSVYGLNTCLTRPCYPHQILAPLPQCPKSMWPLSFFHGVLYKSIPK